MTNNLELKELTQEVIKTVSDLAPSWSLNQNSADFPIIENNSQIESYLNSFYLFPLKEISVPSDFKDVRRFIVERFHNILAAANKSKTSVLFLIKGTKGKTEILIGFKNDNIKQHNEHEVFESILNGVLPGKEIKFQQNTMASKLINNNNRFGGLISGIPLISEDDKKQKFNIASVIRSLYGKEYTLAIISNPVSDEKKSQIFNKLAEIKDKLHSIAKINLSKSEMEGHSFTENESKSLGLSETKGKSYSISGGVLGAAAGLAIGGPVGGIVGFMLGNTLNFSSTSSIGKTTTKTHSTSFTQTKQETFSFSHEQINTIAVELEKMTNFYIERMIKGFNAGFWETAISFAAEDEITANILSGTFIGELSESENKLFPPPKDFIFKLDKDKILPIPKDTSQNQLFPSPLSSYLTTEELSFISSPPYESVPGFEIQKMPSLALTDTVSDSAGIILGNIADHGNPIENTYISLSKKDLNKHIFVCGLTGSGKTTTVKHILKNLVKKENIPLLVLESAKRDYRQLLADEIFKNNLNVFTIGDATISPIRFNPFYVQKGVSPLVHIDYLKAIFNASFSLYGPMPSIVEKCLHSIYVKKGWDLTNGTHPFFINEYGMIDEKRYENEEHYYCFPTLTDLKNEINNYLEKELEYAEELKNNIKTAIIVRLESLSTGAKGLMFNTFDFYPLEKLLNQNTVFEMENLADDDDKAFFTGLMLAFINEFRQKNNPALSPGSSKELKHILVIEEAHRLLKNVETEKISEHIGNPKGKAVEMFCNAISEMRSLGQGVIVVEQIPSKIAPDVVKNSNTKIVHRLVSKDDQSLLAGSLNMEDKDTLYLGRLQTGHALCHKEGMEKPVECVIFHKTKSMAFSNDKIKKIMEKEKIPILHTRKTYELDNIIGYEGDTLAFKYLISLISIKNVDLEKLNKRAKEEFKKILSLKELQLNEYSFADFLTLRIMKLLTTRIFLFANPKRNMPENLKKSIYAILKEANLQEKENLIKKLDKWWYPKTARQFILNLIKNLAIMNKYEINNKIKLEEQETTELMLSFFLIYDKYAINELTENIAMGEV